MPIFFVYLYILAMSGIYGFRLVPENRLEALNDSIITLASFMGSYHLCRAYLQSAIQDGTRICWLLIGIGLFCEGVGYALYAMLELIFHRTILFPSIADLPIALGVLMQIASLILYYRYLEQRTILPSLSRKFLVNSLFLFLIIAHSVFYLLPTMLEPSTRFTVRLLHQFYPTIDLILAYFCIHFFLIWANRDLHLIAKPWTFMILALSILLVTDYAYNYMILTHQYHSYQWMNPGWGLAYLLISHAAYLQRKILTPAHEEEELQFSDDIE